VNVNASNVTDSSVADWEQLKTSVKILEEQVVTAVAFHETWRPAAKDSALHERLGESYATNSFIVIRLALRRELVLTLMRIWDSNPRAAHIFHVRNLLQSKSVFDLLVEDRHGRIGRSVVEPLSDGRGLRGDGAKRFLKSELIAKRKQVRREIGKYMSGGAGESDMQALEKLRNEQLAHRSRSEEAWTGLDPGDEIVESIYQDTLEVVSLLLSLVLGRAFDMGQAKDVWRHHASFFWASVRGEHDKGHPLFFPSIPLDEQSLP
jgi:hypothetical protein